MQQQAEVKPLRGPAAHESSPSGTLGAEQHAPPTPSPSTGGARAVSSPVEPYLHGVEASPATLPILQPRSSTLINQAQSQLPHLKDGSQATAAGTASKPDPHAAETGTMPEQYKGSMTSTGSELQEGSTSQVQGDRPDEFFTAYQAPGMEQAAEAEKEFEEKEAGRYREIVKQAGVAAEAARVTELKSSEALVEAREWANMRSEVAVELKAAKACLDEAESLLAVTEALVNERDQLVAELAGEEAGGGELGGHFPGESAEKGKHEQERLRREMAMQFEARAKELHDQVHNRQMHMDELARAASRIERMAERRAAALKDLESRGTEIKAAAAAMWTDAERTASLAERDYSSAQSKYEALKETAQMGRQSTAAQLYVEARALAERADIKAHGAEMELKKALDAAHQVEIVESSTTQARRDVELLLRRAGELVAFAEAMECGTVSLAEQAYEKACEAREALGNMDLPSVQEEGEYGMEFSRGPEAMQEIRQRYERVKEVAALQEHEAMELLDEARRHARLGKQLEREAEKRAEHIARVLHDADVAHEQEEAALRQVEQLAEHARVVTGGKAAEEWAAFIQSQDWRLAMESQHTLATAQDD